MATYSELVVGEDSCGTQEKVVRARIVKTSILIPIVYLIETLSVYEGIFYHYGKISDQGFNILKRTKGLS